MDVRLVSRLLVIVAFVTISVSVPIGCSEAHADPTPTQVPATNPPEPPAVQPNPAAPAVEPGVRSNLPPVSGAKSGGLWPGDWSQFLSGIGSGLIATFFGALLAFLSAIWIDRKSRERTSRKQNEEQIKLMNERFALLKHELEMNRHELAAVLTDLTTGYSSDHVTVTDSWEAVGIEVLKPGGTLALHLSEAYYLIRRCGRLLNEYTQNFEQGGDSALRVREQTLPALRDAIEKTVPVLVRAIDELEAVVTA